MSLACKVPDSLNTINQRKDLRAPASVGAGEGILDKNRLMEDWPHAVPFVGD